MKNILLFSLLVLGGQGALAATEAMDWGTFFNDTMDVRDSDESTGHCLDPKGPVSQEDPLAIGRLEPENAPSVLGFDLYEDPSKDLDLCSLRPGESASDGRPATKRKLGPEDIGKDEEERKKTVQVGSTKPKKNSQAKKAKKNLEFIKGRWTEQEDEILLGKAKETGGRFRSKGVAVYIPGRCGKQCRERWKFLNSKGWRKQLTTDQNVFIEKFVLQAKRIIQSGDIQKGIGELSDFELQSVLKQYFREEAGASGWRKYTFRSMARFLTIHFKLAIPIDEENGTKNIYHSYCRKEKRAAHVVY